MKLFRSFARALAAVGLVFSLGAAQAASVNIYVDAAPNKYGSPLYAAWETAALASAANGSFVNMANATNPANAGSTGFSINDLVVYSFGDLGKRLSYVYFIAGETKASLSGRLDVALSYDWDGTTYDAYNDYYGSTWLAPSTLFDVAGGVVGIAGWAWWGGYNTNTQAELDADLAAWGPSQGDLTFQVRIKNATGAIESQTALTSVANAVPEPGSLALAGLALFAAVTLRRRA